jgi:hypothetical protein
LTALLVFVLIAASLPTVLVANAETELEKAERLAAETQRSRNVAESAYVTDRATASDLEVRLSVTLETYQRVNAELENLGLQLAGERADMDVIRAEVIALDNEAQERAVGAYIRSLAAPGSSMFLSGTFESLSVANETIKRASELDESLFEQLDSRRADLAEHTIELQSGLDDLALLNDELAAARIELDELFTLADARVAEAFRNLEAADEEYRAAQADLKEAQAKYRWTGSVEQWRWLVEKYFPADRVDEALRVMACESRGNPNAKNPSSSATGLFQFLDGTWAWMSVMSGWGGYSRLDPEANTAVAAYLMNFSIRSGHPGGAWGHWECKP